jgi:hypothetical protein
MVSEVPISHLKILAEQRKSIDAMYHSDSKRVFGLSPEELKEVGQCYGNLIDFMSKLERIMNLPPSPLPQDPLPAPS